MRGRSLRPRPPPTRMHTFPSHQADMPSHRCAGWPQPRLVLSIATIQTLLLVALAPGGLVGTASAQAFFMDSVGGWVTLRALQVRCWQRPVGSQAPLRVPPSMRGCAHLRVCSPARLCGRDVCEWCVLTPCDVLRGGRCVTGVYSPAASLVVVDV
jgi:hypothetical protein